MRSKRLNRARIYRKKRQRFTFLVIATAFMALPFFTGPFTLAGYISSNVVNTYTATAERDFYFTSDLLTDAAEVPVYQITHDWRTAATITFQLRNYENGLNVSGKEIRYTASVSPAGVSTSGTISPAGTSGQSRTVNLSVPVPADPHKPMEVLVTATSTYPYAKTLKGKFVILPAVSCSVADNAGSPVATLVLTLTGSEQPARTVTITWQDGAFPDMTSPVVQNALSIDLANRTLTASLNTAAAYELVFFKENAAVNYTGVTATGA